MSIQKIVSSAIENNPLQLKEAFEEEMGARIRVALAEKYKKMTKEMSEEECDNCDGDGVVEVNGEEVECPVCEGKGVIHDEEDEDEEDEDEDGEDEKK